MNETLNFVFPKRSATHNSGGEYWKQRQRMIPRRKFKHTRAPHQKKAGERDEVGLHRSPMSLPLRRVWDGRDWRQSSLTPESASIFGESRHVICVHCPVFFKSTVSPRQDCSVPWQCFIHSTPWHTVPVQAFLFRETVTPSLASVHTVMATLFIDPSCTHISSTPLVPTALASSAVSFPQPPRSNGTKPATFELCKHPTPSSQQAVKLLIRAAWCASPENHHECATSSAHLRGRQSRKKTKQKTSTVQERLPAATHACELPA